MQESPIHCPHMKKMLKLAFDDFETFLVQISCWWQILLCFCRELKMLLKKCAEILVENLPREILC